jgi:transcriptional regulator with XRE-family HTH domain
MNWQKLLSDLKDLGLTQMQIAERCACAQTTISDLATGATKQPGYAIGASLLALAQEHTGAPVTAISD